MNPRAAQSAPAASNDGRKGDSLMTDNFGSSAALTTALKTIGASLKPRRREKKSYFNSHILPSWAIDSSLFIQPNDTLPSFIRNVENVQICACRCHPIAVWNGISQCFSDFQSILGRRSNCEPDIMLLYHLFSPQPSDMTLLRRYNIQRMQGSWWTNDACTMYTLTPPGKIIRDLISFLIKCSIHTAPIYGMHMACPTATHIYPQNSIHIDMSQNEVVIQIIYSAIGI